MHRDTILDHVIVLVSDYQSVRNSFGYLFGFWDPFQGRQQQHQHVENVKDLLHSVAKPRLDPRNFCGPISQ